MLMMPDSCITCPLSELAMGDDPPFCPLLLKYVYVELGEVDKDCPLVGVIT